MHFSTLIPTISLFISSISATTLSPRQSATESLVENTYQNIRPLFSSLGYDIKTWAYPCYSTENPIGAIIRSVENQQRIAGIMNQAADQVKRSGSMTLADTSRNDDWIPDLTISVIDAMKAWVQGKDVVNQVGQGQTVLSSLLDLQKATDNFRWAVQGKLPLSMTLAWNQDRKTQLAAIGQAVKAFQLF